MSTKAPAYQRYPKDYMSDGNVLRMSFEERGIYDWLLDSCWIEDGIPDDVNELARICSLSPKKMAKAWRRIAPCFITHPRREGWLTNRRLEKEREAQAEFRQSMSEAGRRGAEKRWGGHKPGHPPDGGQAIDRPMASDSSAVRSSQSAVRDRTSTPGRGSGVENSRAAPRMRLLALAADVCGMGVWNADEKRRATSVLTRWIGHGITEGRIENAIRGARMLVDAGKVSWLKPRLPFGLRALHNTGTLFDQGDGKAARPFFDVAEETYAATLAKPSGARGGGPTAIGGIADRLVAEAS